MKYILISVPTCDKDGGELLVKHEELSKLLHPITDRQTLHFGGRGLSLTVKEVENNSFTTEESPYALVVWCEMVSPEQVPDLLEIGFAIDGTEAAIEERRELGI